MVVKNLTCCTEVESRRKPKKVESVRDASCHVLGLNVGAVVYDALAES